MIAAGARRLRWAVLLVLLGLGAGCGSPSGGSQAGPEAGGAILPSSWGAGRYSACPAAVNGSGFSGVPGPGCRQGTYVDGKIQLPPGPWAITVTDPGGCNDGSDAEGGAFAEVPERGWVQVGGVSAAACGNLHSGAPPVTTGPPEQHAQAPPAASPCPPDMSTPSMATGSFCGPAPHAGNGLGPDGLCTGQETRPPCGPGAVAGRYYAYTLPGSCDGRVVFDGRLWVSELPPPTQRPDMYVWMRLDPDGDLGFIAPNGAVGFLPDTGKPPSACRESPSPTT